MNTPIPDQTKDRIMEAAHELFYQYGIRSVSMDDIARHLAMSKKTIYRYYQNKEDIVHACCTLDLQGHCSNCQDINATSENAVHEIIGIMRFLSGMFARMNPNLFFDLKKYHPRSYRAFRQFKEENMLGMVEENLRRGIREGLYRDDIDVSILSRLRIEQVELGMNAEIFPPERFDYVKVQLTLLDHFLHGIVTLEGLKLIESYRSIESSIHPQHTGVW